jgi:hypothetical protein
MLGGMDAPELAAVTRALAGGAEPSTIVLVEGASDKAALETLAGRRGRDLEAEGVSIVPMGGATTIGHFLDLLGPHGYDFRLAGLCDAGEEGEFRRGLEKAGLGTNITRPEMESLGFFVCDADLEEELIRSLGAAAVEQVIEDQGEIGSMRRMQRQPAQRGRTVEQQLWRFMGTRSGRKVTYARLLVEALELDNVPRPLDRVLEYVKARDDPRDVPISGAAAASGSGDERGCDVDSRGDIVIVGVEESTPHHEASDAG